MGSIGDPAPVIGQYMLPFIDEHTKNDDPWQRSYGQPPKTLQANLVPRSYPLVDIRSLLPANSATDLLKSHGFGVVKHHSPFIDQVRDVDSQLEEKDMTEKYYPEMEQLVKDTLGAKRVITMNAAMRQGKRAPEVFKFPVGIQQIKDVVAAEDKAQNPNNNVKTSNTDEAKKAKLAKQAGLMLGAPIRVAHMDFTDQGARATIRRLSKDVYEAAEEAIAFEDRICASQPFDSGADEANALIYERYNQDSELGPRYAAYSIWRPLRKVERDPITLGSPGFAGDAAPGQTDGEMVYWPYLNKISGAQELGGDYLREFAMLGVNKKGQASIGNSDNAGKWYYVSNQEPDEVLFIKQFDSAARGSNAQHAPAPWHGSPEIGNVHGDAPRESIELRIIAFW